MAQFLPKSDTYFESHWRPRILLGSKVLDDAQDSWIMNDSDFPTDLVTAVLFWIFRFDFHEADFLGYTGLKPKDLQKLSLPDWQNLVQSVEIEFHLLLPNLSGSKHHDAAKAFSEIIGRALISWNKLPQSPSTGEVVLECAEWLAKNCHVKIR